MYMFTSIKSGSKPWTTVFQDVVLYRTTGGRTLKTVIDFVGSEKTLETYIDMLSPLGTYVVVGL